jgi:RNA polymerase sigma factor (sigma-70 family)
MPLGNKSTQSEKIGDDGGLLRPVTQVDSLYANYAARVRVHLSTFGVRPIDVDDLSQEVFLIVMAKREGLARIERIDPWLREICRKVAAGHRRRAFRLREVSGEEDLLSADESLPLQCTALELEEDAARLYQAVDALDDEAKDLIALHELGGLPLVEVATLVERDRKTVKKRLDEANRRLTRLFREHEPSREAMGSRSSGTYAVPDPARGAQVDARTLLALGGNADIEIGQIGSVLLAVWPGAPTLGALTLLDEQLHAAVTRCGGGLVYLAVVESTTSAPALAARKKIASMLKEHSTTFGVYPHVLLGGFSWIARPIMAGLAFLTGVPLPMPFFGSVERAATWLCAGYLQDSALEAEDIVRGTLQLQALASARRTAREAPRADVLVAQ